tara:strand:- start:1179 stop:1643 length:465 start_codon:yes stop_codon:yes gene_type:complete
MGFVSCLEDQQKRFESDFHLLHKEIQRGDVSGESAKKEALRLLGDAKVSWAKTLNWLGELTEPECLHSESVEELRERCSKMDSMLVSAEDRSSRLSNLTGLLFLHNESLRAQLKKERLERKRLEKEFEKMGRQNFAQLVEPFLSKGMFDRHTRQ